MYIPDNYNRWKQHDDEMERQLNALPKCHSCKEPIQQEKAVCIDGKYYCDECLEDFEVWIVE